MLFLFLFRLPVNAVHWMIVWCLFKPTSLLRPLEAPGAFKKRVLRSTRYFDTPHGLSHGSYDIILSISDNISGHASQNPKWKTDTCSVYNFACGAQVRWNKIGELIFKLCFDLWSLNSFENWDKILDSEMRTRYLSTTTGLFPFWFTRLEACEKSCILK